ncbi:2OG-Fe(II) oxygenase [Aquabacterium parvum]|jgi:prolyl 4-hydroxylase|uniref:2OG-Fe(II) oxygenase n=1 Tax=Aquabacterium parvum TaxID=70584 RepID=UPI000718F517|nr:2OG-Fe(II) oxygenase [Aquabacterium parvum]MBU0916025.1 2OG-Fe(II) oxygenase [Gammaproteobacteria bacterium]
MNSRQTITPELREWLLAQVAAGHSADRVLASMQASGWDSSVAMEAIREVMPDALHDLASVALEMPDLPNGAGHRVQAHDRWVDVLVCMRQPRIVVFRGLLADAECDALIELARPRLSRSETVVNRTGGSEVNAARTSQGMFFSRGEGALVGAVEARIAALLNWPVDRGEGLQVLRYGVGAEYRPHFDYFDPAQPGSPAILKRGGQRVGTVLMYLNTPESGGATTFPDAGIEVHAQRGSAVFFSYEQPSPLTRTLHGGAPVLAGEKWVATKWLRAGRFD